MYKSKLQIPLNQEIEKIIILTNNDQINLINDLKEDITNTIRIKELKILNKSEENIINKDAEFKENLEDIDVIIYVFI